MTEHRDEDSLFVSPIEKPLGYVPVRVVSLVPSLTESLFDLDLGDRVIAVTDYCIRPSNKVKFLPRVGGTKDPDITRIIDLQPDLVLLNDEENRRSDAKALTDAGISVWVTGPRTIFDALNLLWNLMAVFDHGVMSARVREIERAYDYQQAAAQTITPVRVFVPIWRDPWMTFTSGTYAHDIIRVCGGLNVFSDYADTSRSEDDAGPISSRAESQIPVADRDHRYPRITPDRILEAQPELVLLPDDPYRFDQTDVSYFRQLDIPASRTGHIYTVDGSLLTWHGTRTGYALRDLPEIIMGGDIRHETAHN